MSPTNETVITINEIASEHFELVANWLSNPKINRWLTGDWRDKTASPLLVAMMVRNKRNRVFLIHCDDKPRGLVALADIDSADKTAMVWYLLGDPTFAGRGITSGALKQLAVFSFRTIGLKSLTAWIMEDNRPSERVLKKVGFREVGRVRQATSSGGLQVDRIYFDLVADDVR